MSDLELRLRDSLKENKIKEMPFEELSRGVTRLIGETFALTGFHTYSGNDIGILSAKLAADLRESHAFLTFGEVSICFELGAKGQYGDFQGINIRTFTRWLRAYQTSDLRYRAVVEREQARERLALPEVSEAYKDERERAFLRRVFQQYKAGYPLERLYPSYVYQALQRRGAIRDTPADKRRAMSLFACWKPANGLPISEDTRQAIIKQRAMAWLLKRYFDGLIKKQIDN